MEFHKYVMPVGIAWLGLALILGLVMAIQPLLRLSRVSSSETVMYVPVRASSPSPATDKEQVKTSARVGLPLEGEKAETKATVVEKK